MRKMLDSAFTISLIPPTSPTSTIFYSTIFYSTIFISTIFAHFHPSIHHLLLVLHHGDNSLSGNTDESQFSLFYSIHIEPVLGHFFHVGKKQVAEGINHREDSIKQPAIGSFDSQVGAYIFARIHL